MKITHKIEKFFNPNKFKAVQESKPTLNLLEIKEIHFPAKDIQALHQCGGCGVVSCSDNSCGDDSCS